MALHRNSNRNEAPHHLYEIWDKETDEVFKYGISDDPIDVEDGLSDRVRDQLYYLNLAASWVRYIGRILFIEIIGKMLARKLEDEHIDAYQKEHGKRPRGNPIRRKSKFDPLFPEQDSGESQPPNI